MDYEKEYKDALDRAKAGKPIDDVFPELKESEDERIRNEIITFIEQAIHSGGGTIIPEEKEDKLLSYLEKQKEQKPAEWSEEDKVMLNNIIWAVHMKSIQPLDEMDDRSRYKKYEDFLKSLPIRFSLQPKQEWSEEDEKVYTFIYDFFENCWWNKTWDISREQTLKILKSLRLQPHWKPSEKQMIALEWKINNTPVGAWQRKELESLYKELKKL